MAAQLTSTNALLRRRLSCVDGSRHQLLAGAVLAVDQDAAVGRSGHGDLLAELPDRVALADHRLVAIDAGAKREILHFEPALTQRVAHDQHRLLERQRLLDEIERAQLDGADRRFDVAVARDQHDLRVHLPLAQARERGQAVHAGQPHVEHDQIDRAAREPIEARLAARHRLDGVALVPEHAGERRPDAGLVVDDQDGRFHRRLEHEVRRSRSSGEHSCSSCLRAS